ncbi:uncharacterized protein LOC121870756 [Homarus americanus]|uniref:uncharacterized protein LOC121870756 n=1 Tax=Homarus americanus TaxID=6706 RepID=UPI001C46D40E|nr:uncharacterized protein LOC121870756 [Homarus americanus]
MLWRVMVVAVAAAGCGGVIEAVEMKDTIKDLYEAPPEGQQGRLFLNYDQAAAFNTSVAFTIPLFSFTLPGAGDTTAAGLDTQSFGAIAFIALFLLGGLGVAIYTTSQGATGRQFFEGQSDLQESLLAKIVTESLAGLPNVIDTRSCAQLAICGAYAESSRYGFLAWPVRLLVPSPHSVPEEEMTEYQRAAMYGDEGEQDCLYEYPCLVQPLEILLYVYDYWYGED